MSVSQSLPSPSRGLIKRANKLGMEFDNHPVKHKIYIQLSASKHLNFHYRPIFFPFFLKTIIATIFFFTYSPASYEYLPYLL